jgi:hypothetical protein
VEETAKTIAVSRKTVYRHLLLPNAPKRLRVAPSLVSRASASNISSGATRVKDSQMTTTDDSPPAGKVEEEENSLPRRDGCHGG